MLEPENRQLIYFETEMSAVQGKTMFSGADKSNCIFFKQAGRFTENLRNIDMSFDIIVAKSQ